MRAVDLRPAAIADGEGQDQDADQRREEEDDPQLEEKQRVDPRGVGRGLLGKQREVPHDALSPQECETRDDDDSMRPDCDSRGGGFPRAASPLAAEHHEEEGAQRKARSTVPRTRISRTIESVYLPVAAS